MLHGIEADGAQRQGVVHRALHFLEVKRLEEAKDLHVLAAPHPARARLHEPAKGVERLGQFPPDQRRRLVQRAELALEQRQIVQGVEDHVLAFVGAHRTGDDFACAADDHPVMRAQLVKFRTAQINALRGLLAEYGEVMPQGRSGIRRGIAEALERVSERLPAMVIETLREQWARVAELDAQVGEIERRLRQWHRGNQASRRIAEIPGVGVLGATAAVATMADPSAFRSGREFAAWLGLVPRHRGTAGRVLLLGISKRGDTYLRTLLIHGARSVLITSKAPPEWALRVAARRPFNVAVVALANKMARTLWALLAHDRVYRHDVSGSPA